MCVICLKFLSREQALLAAESRAKLEMLKTQHREQYEALKSELENVSKGFSNNLIVR